MNIDSGLKIESLLSRVRQPGRYIGSEVNSVKKDWEKAGVRLCLAFPDLYEVGMSHFGMQILYFLVNREPDFLAERSFAPDADMEDLLRKEGVPLFSLESRKALSDFDILGFSLLYELNYTNILLMLDLAGIPFRALDRDLTHPLVIAGGPATVNPGPVAAFFDAMLIGDGEEAAISILRAYEAWKKGGGADKKALLAALKEIEGVYVPALEDDKPGPVVRRAILPELLTGHFPQKPVLGYAKPVHDRLRVEIARGCGRGCRFCQAGMVYRPLRERSASDIVQLTCECLAGTGYEDVSILSLSTGDHSQIAPVLSTLMGWCRDQRVAVSLPSMRAGTLTEGLMAEIRRVRKTGFTIAPEAGSQRLRDVIGKNLTEKDIADTVRAAFDAGWKLIKLYFMVGLPTETDEDVEALALLVKELKKIAGKRADITVSVGIFVPKPHTPFQWAAQIRPDEAQEKISRIKGLLHGPGIKIKWQSPETSLLEGVFARGDERLSKALETAYASGCRFDGWSDRYRHDLWLKAFEAEGIDPLLYLCARDIEKPLPWDRVDIGIDREYLLSEWRKALNNEPGGPSCQESCQGCGVCDFDRVKPRISPPLSPVDSPPAIGGFKKDLGRRIVVTYAKTGKARFLGHLELMSVILRALRRARIPLVFSEGFHPLPKVSFSQALPVLMESLDEFFIVTTGPKVTPAELQKRLSAELPEGIEVSDCLYEQFFKKPDTALGRFSVVFDGYAPDPAALDRFLSADAFSVTRTNKKGETVELDLRQLVKVIGVAENRVDLLLVTEPGKSVKPLAVVKSLWNPSEEALTGARVTKTPV